MTGRLSDAGPAGAPVVAPGAGGLCTARPRSAPRQAASRHEEMDAAASRVEASALPFVAIMPRGERHSMPMLRSDALGRTYVSGGREITVLRDITFDLEAGGFLAISGPSGSGKSTLLGLLAGLDRPTRGRVLLDGQDLSALSEDQRALVRAQKVGFVFQAFHLIPTLTAQENVQVPLELRGEEPRGRARELLERVGLA